MCLGRPPHHRPQTHPSSSGFPSSSDNHWEWNEPVTFSPDLDTPPVVSRAAARAWPWRAPAGCDPIHIVVSPARAGISDTAGRLPVPTPCSRTACAALQLVQDWRAFRARLVGREERWAHVLAQPERGCLLVAKPKPGLGMFSNTGGRSLGAAQAAGALLLDQPSCWRVLQHMRSPGLPAQPIMHAANMRVVPPSWPAVILLLEHEDGEGSSGLVSGVWHAAARRKHAWSAGSLALAVRHAE